MKSRKRRTAALPRLTVLAYSRRELERFSTAAEKVVALAESMERFYVSLIETVTRLEAAAEVLDKRRRRNGAAAAAPPPG